MHQMLAVAPHRVAVLAYNGLQMFEFGIAIEAFAKPRPELADWYACTIVAGDPGPWTLGAGMTGAASAGLDALADAQTIVIPGWRDHRELPPPQTLEALREAQRRGARFLSICLGAFVLAAAGLLDGRRATTHWAYARALQKRYPRVLLEPDVLYVDDGDIITSAGSAAGIDTCLHLIRRDFGGRTANHIARAMVVPPHREGGQAQYVEAPVHVRPGRAIGAVMEWARERLDRPLSVEDLANHASMSRRTLLRRFAEATGTTPKAWLTRERLHRAQTLLETTALPLERIADASGFNSMESFRVAFRRRLKTSPGAYRRRFGGHPTTLQTERTDQALA